MWRARILGLAVILILTINGAWAGEFKPYPGSIVDQKATEESRKMAAQSGLKDTLSTIYTSMDSFEKVKGFYSGLAKEYIMPGPAIRKLPNGQELKQSFFIFDGAKDLASSKLWISVSRPYVADFEFKDIRNITAIVVSQKK